MKINDLDYVTVYYWHAHFQLPGSPSKELVVLYALRIRRAKIFLLTLSESVTQKILV